MKEERGREKQRDTNWCDKHYYHWLQLQNFYYFFRFKVYYYKKKSILEKGIKSWWRRNSTSLPKASRQRHQARLDTYHLEGSIAWQTLIWKPGNGELALNKAQRKLKVETSAAVKVFMARTLYKMFQMQCAGYSHNTWRRTSFSHLACSGRIIVEAPTHV